MRAECMGERAMKNPRPWNCLATIVFGVFSLLVHAETASAQAADLAVLGQ